MPSASFIGHHVTDIVVQKGDDPFYVVSKPAPSVPTDPEQLLVASLERAMFAIVAAGVSLLAAALLGNGARSSQLAQDGSLFCAACAILAVAVAIFSTIQGVARFLRLFRTLG